MVADCGAGLDPEVPAGTADEGQQAVVNKLNIPQPGQEVGKHHLLPFGVGAGEPLTYVCGREAVTHLTIPRYPL